MSTTSDMTLGEAQNPGEFGYPSELPPAVVAAIREHLAAVEAHLARAGVPGAERQYIVGDLQAQILEVLTTRLGEAGLEEAIPEDVEAILAEMDPPASYARTAAGLDADAEGQLPPPVPAPYGRRQDDAEKREKATPGEFSLGSKIWTFLGAVLLPAIALGVELTSHTSALQIFDPIPTTAHVVLVAAVPAIALLLIPLLSKRRWQPGRLISFALGLALGISGIYAAFYLPVAPFAVLAIMFFGFGLLPLSPLISFFTYLMLWSTLRLRDEVSFSRMRWIRWLGVLAGVALPVFAQVPRFVTDSVIIDAASSDAAKRERALTWIRLVGGEDRVLELCYQRNGRGGVRFAPEFSGSDPEGNAIEAARETYYRLTGRSFTSVPLPFEIPIGAGTGLVDAMEVDPQNRNIGVGVEDARLQLTASRLDGVVEPDAGFGYLEWTLNFHNEMTWQREARCEIQLPPGGVVSRVTLWVNGEEREAAFSSTSHVKAAYERVVTVQRRDPVLVTTSGSDRVMVQCFPVPANGDMKTRIGITFPLPLRSRELAEVHLPRFTQRNFAVPEETKHLVWVESGGKLEGAPEGVTLGPGEAGYFRLTGSLEEKALFESRAVTASRKTGAAQDEMVMRDTRDPEKFVIRQTIEEVGTKAPPRLVLVVDGSAPMEEKLEELKQAVRSAPRGTEVKLVVASDRQPAVLKASARRDDGEIVARQLEAVSFTGGQDAVPALERAWDLATAVPGSAIVWVHGPQPIKLAPPEGLVQRLERSRNRPAIYDVQPFPGQNVVAAELDRLVGLRSAPRNEEGQQDLARLFAEWNSADKRLEYRRERLPVRPEDAETTVGRFSGHLGRLWAYELALNHFRDGSPNKLQEAIELAVRYQLVTPATGAVVLENMAQYREAGLDPVNPNSVPTIPEPETWALLILVAGVVVWTIWRRRRGDGGDGLFRAA